MDNVRKAPRIGVVGLGMGLYLAEWSERVGLRVVMACDRDAERLAAAERTLPHAQPTQRWQDLLSPELDLDGVVLANDFDAHAPLAVSFLDHGISVLSESAACADEEEGRRLLTAARRSPASYSFAENYVAHPHVRLVQRVLQDGELGRVTSIETDYLHGLAPEAVSELVRDPAHWRGRISPAAYCTHTVSPVLALTGEVPREVTAFAIDEKDPRAGVVLLLRLSGGGLAVCRHGFLQGEPDSHWSWLSVRGERGLAESVRAPGERAWSVRLRQEAWATTDGAVRDEELVPPRLRLDQPPGTVVERAAEGTVRVLTAFRETLAVGAPPLVPVRQAVIASLVGVAGARSLERDSRPVAMPDLDAAG